MPVRFDNGGSMEALSTTALVERPKDVSVPSTLSGHAATIWHDAFMSAYSGTCAKQKDKDACAARIAWSAVKNGYKKNSDGEWVKKAEDPAMNEIDTGASENGNLPVAIEPDRPVLPTPQNLTRAEAQTWDMAYMQAIKAECAQSDSPEACAARKAWDAVKAMGEEADLDEETPTEGEMAEEDAAAQPEAEVEGDITVSEDEAPEEEAEGETETGDDEEAEAADGQDGEQPQQDGEQAPPGDESAQPEGEVPDLATVMGKVSSGEELDDTDKKVLSAAIDAVKEGEADQEKIGALDAIMSKVSNGQSLSEEEQKMLSVALSALKQKSMVERKDYSAEKRREFAKKGWALSDGSFPIADCGDVGDAVRSFGRNKGSDKRVKQHIMKRARALGCTEKIPAEWKGSTIKSMAAEGGDMVKRTEYSKREKAALIAAGRALPDGRMPIISKSDVSDALEAVRNVKAADPEVVRHIIIRAGSLGALELLPDEWLNKGTAIGLSKVPEGWVKRTVERAVRTIEDRDWLATVGETTKVTRPSYISSQNWTKLPAVERSARAEYLRRFIRRMYDQAVDDMKAMGWQAEPMKGRPHEMQFKRWLKTDEGPLLQRAILIRKVGSTDWKVREVGRGASLSSAIKTLPDEVRP